MTTPVLPPPRPVAVSRLLLALACLFFLIDTLFAGGMLHGSGPGWLLPAGLLCFALSFLAPLW